MRWAMSILHRIWSKGGGEAMAAKTVAFRINPKNREDQEIMEWLDEVVHQQQIYESYTEALKWAVLSFLRGEAKSREQLDTLETVQRFVKDYAEQSKVDTEKIVQNAITQTLATVVGAMGHQGFGYPQMQVPMPYAPVQSMPVSEAQQSIQAGTVVESTKNEVKEKEAELPENLLGYSNAPMDGGTAASLAAMFSDDDEDD